MAVSDAASAKRSAAEAGIDPATVVAEMQRVEALAQSPTNTDVLVAKAATLLKDGQPRLSKTYLDAAQQRGALPLGVHELVASVEAALDQAVPERAEARAIEVAGAEAFAKFTEERLAALAESVGSDEDGRSAGNGSPSARSAAAMRLQMLRFAGAQQRGEAYEEQATIEPDGGRQKVGTSFTEVQRRTS